MTARVGSRTVALRNCDCGKRYETSPLLPASHCGGCAEETEEGIRGGQGHEPEAVVGSAFLFGLALVALGALVVIARLWAGF